MWIARDKNGNLRWFETKPNRDWGNYNDYLRNELTVWKDGVIENNEHTLAIDLFTELKWEDEPIEVTLCEVGLAEKYEELKDAYDSLHMMYLSQVSLYKSLYKEEKKKNTNNVGG